MAVRFRSTPRTITADARAGLRHFEGPFEPSASALLALAATARLAAELAPGPPALRDRWRSEALAAQTDAEEDRAETGIWYCVELEVRSLRDKEDPP